MYKRLAIWTIAVLFSVSFFGCATSSFTDFKPASTDEKNIYATMSGMADCRDRGDVKGYMSYIHKDAKIRPGGRDQNIVSKEEYLPIIKKRFADGVKTPWATAPKMKVSGDKAEVEIWAAVPEHPRGGITMSFLMVRENGKWLIIRQDY